MPGSMELVASAWRSLMHSAAGTGSSGIHSAALAAIAADLAAGRCILEQIQLQLAQAFHKHGAHALSPDEIAPIKALCDQLLPAHFQLSVPEPHQGPATPRRKACRVRYQHIWEDDKFSMGIFILPPGASIPLHDHPEMSVISRVLYGDLHVKSCDIVPPQDAVSLAERYFSDAQDGAAPPQLIARMCADEMIRAPHTTELLPDHGNLHEFVAGDAIGCAIFDILTPPYEPDDGRDCTYYRFVGDARATDSEPVAALEVFDPEFFEVASEPYLGPPLALLPTTAVSTASSSSSRSSSGSSSPPPSLSP